MATGNHVLVTGGAGFIGSHLVDRLVKLGHSVTVLDDLSTGKRENLNTSCRLLVGDIRDHEFVRQSVIGQEVVFHLGAFTSVAGSIEDPAICLDINVNGTANLLANASRSGVGRVVFSSTSAVYPDYPDILCSESTPPEPKSPYAESKLQGESLLQQYGQNQGLSWAALRYFNVFGPRQDANSDYAAVIPAFISNIQKDQSLTIFGDGHQTRDFVYVEDVARANILAMGSRESGIFNVGTSRPTSILSLAKTLIRLGGSGKGYTFAKSRPGDALSSTADISAISSQLNWSPRWKLDEGLAETSRWFNSQESVSVS